MKETWPNHNQIWCNDWTVFPHPCPIPTKNFDYYLLILTLWTLNIIFLCGFILELVLFYFRPDESAMYSLLEWNEEPIIPTDIYFVFGIPHRSRIALPVLRKLVIRGMFDTWIAKILNSKKIFIHQNNSYEIIISSEKNKTNKKRNFWSPVMGNLPQR